MTDIKVSQRAREAAHDWIRTAPLAVKMAMVGPSSLYEAFARFEQAIRADEREMAAKVAEWHGENVSNEKIGKACSRNIATAIRAQGDEA